MEKSIKIAFLLISIAVGGCRTKIDVIGKYASKINSNIIHLKDDSTFQYQYRAFHLVENSSGNWTLKNNRLVLLQSNIKSTVVPLDVKENLDTAQQNRSTLKVNFHVIGKELSDYSIKCIVNEDQIINRRGDSINTLQFDGPINKISFKILSAPRLLTSNLISQPLSTEVYITKGNSASSFDINIKVDPKLFFYTSFNDEQLKVGEGYVKLYNDFKKRWEKIEKVNDSVNVFINGSW